MISFEKDLNERLKDKEFKKGYEEELELAKILIKIAQYRQKYGLSQKELAQKANLTQQQISKIEHGEVCSIRTFYKVCTALNLHINIEC